MASRKAKAAQPPQSATNIIGNVFHNGVHWDGKALESVQTVAQALLNLTQLFKAQGVTVDALLKVESVGAQRPEGASPEG